MSIRTWSGASRRAVATVAVLAGALAPSIALVGTASASTPSVSSVIKTVTANMKSVPAIEATGTESGLKVSAVNVARQKAAKESLSGTLKGTKIQVSMLEIGTKNWIQANLGGWELFTLGLVPRSTLAKLSPTTWYSGSGSSTITNGSTLCAASSSGKCTLKGTKLVSYTPSKAVISVASPKETIRLASVRGKLLPTSLVATGSNAVTLNLSYPANAPKITAPSGAKPFPAKL